MFKHIDRHNAEEDLRLLDVMAASQSQEAFGQLNKALKQRLGLVVRRTGAPNELDRRGLAELKRLRQR